MDDEHAILLRQIRGRLTVIAVAVVAIACVFVAPYAWAVAALVIDLLDSTAAWLVVIGASFVFFTIVMAIAVFAGRRPAPRGFEPTMTAKPIDP